LARVSEQRREERRKQTVTLRLSPQALKTAKSLGKGYTSVLSRILESALTDAELIKHYL
ncbi:MAG: BrnA antitoxin family protein, partial [Oscillospiraceae bacterium]|nr:BrnA antitoxin family protein [Oscillospiraceae bacterium]